MACKRAPNAAVQAATSPPNGEETLKMARKWEAILVER
jgi:hypothetical protein